MFGDKANHVQCLDVSVFVVWLLPFTQKIVYGKFLAVARLADNIIKSKCHFLYVECWSKKTGNFSSMTRDGLN